MWGRGSPRPKIVRFNLTFGREPSMTHEAVSPLRRRMIDDMTIRQFGAKTQADSIRTVRTFAAFLGQSPGQAEPEDLRRFQLHVLPDGFHRIRHYGLLASGTRAANIARIRSLLAPAPPSDAVDRQSAHDETPAPACPCCGRRLMIIERFRPGAHPRT